MRFQIAKSYLQIPYTPVGNSDLSTINNRRISSTPVRLQNCLAKPVGVANNYAKIV
ncbi:MAG: hypothetical protein KME23_27530 [Goleter apudmare HA4340-LM2]|nr:hypothetical protein [Goleter apudmare HA4340-LM2]